METLTENHLHQMGFTGPDINPKTGVVYYTLQVSTVGGIAEIQATVIPPGGYALFLIEDHRQPLEGRFYPVGKLFSDEAGFRHQVTVLEDMAQEWASNPSAPD
jgi:hypothetical protein